MPFGCGCDGVNVVVRADDCGVVADGRGSPPRWWRSGSDQSLQVVRRGDDCRDDRIPLATGLPRDGDEVVHCED